MYFEIACKEVVAIYILLDYVTPLYQFYSTLTEIEDDSIFISANCVSKYYMPYFLTCLQLAHFIFAPIFKMIKTQFINI